MNFTDRLRFTIEAAKARAESQPQARISKWFEERAEEKRRELYEKPVRDFYTALFEELDE